MNKQEIIDKLTELKITFDASATKAELQKLLPDADSDADDSTSDLDSELDAINAEANEKAKIPEKTPEELLKEYMKIVAAYKKQNPKKYEIKKPAFEKKIADLKANVK